jgi:hypothetical protein
MNALKEKGGDRKAIAVTRYWFSAIGPQIPRRYRLVPLSRSGMRRSRRIRGQKSGRKGFAHVPRRTDGGGPVTAAQQRPGFQRTERSKLRRRKDEGIKDAELGLRNAKEEVTSETTLDSG